MRYREPRRPAEVAANMHTSEGVSSGVVRSVSASGLKVEAVSPPEDGTEIAVEMLGITRDATVVWCQGTFVALRFKTPLSSTELAAIHRPSSVSPNEIQRSAKNPFGHGFRELR